MVGKQLYLGGYPAKTVENKVMYGSNYYHFGIYGDVQHFEDLEEENYGYIAHSQDASQGQSGAPL